MKIGRRRRWRGGEECEEDWDEKNVRKMGRRRM